MLELNYIVKSKSWNNFLQQIDINNCVSNIFDVVIKVLNYNISKKKIIELSITFTDDKEIQKINKQFRNCDKPTNVLSFPMYENEFLNVLQFENYLPIGDIILSYDTVLKESLEQDKTFENHLVHLVVHSILHLFGFDHIKDDDADKMEGLEIKILGVLGIENPYI